MAMGGSALFLASSMITHFEGLRLKPYFDGAGILSVSYGHTGNDIERNRTYTKAECDKWLGDGFESDKASC
ncbi:glycoside hydrolase family protein [Arsenophonus endosymbiont of Bemisia tabaci]|uniref:glycoside hydrolase family protein n=1 Tax=Arsenophonus endosymbiont of Bemisia tabaci TaxID=536059 RepID=UPI001757D463|nr:Lysozyme RrrD [Arsenophonus endosymbiont of Bemisia tabaci Q2]